MGRMTDFARTRPIKEILTSALILCGVLSLALCSNPVDIVDKVTTAVMAANDRFLEVDGTAPAPFATAVDPNGSVLVRFDRPVDAESLNASTIAIRTNLGSALAIQFPVAVENGGKDVRIYPEAYFENTTAYIVRLEGIRSLEGDAMREAVAWSFMTGIAPAGNFTIASTNALARTGFTNTATVNLSFSVNEFVTGCYISQENPSSIEHMGAIPEESWSAVSTRTFSVNGYALADTASQGDKAVWVVFRYAATGTYQYSTIRSASITYDSVAPIVDAGTSIVTNASGTTSPVITELHPHSWAWSASGTGVSFGTPGAAITTVSASGDGDRTLTLLVTDKAGNQGSDTLLFTRDTLAPVVTMSTAIYTKTASPLAPTVTEFHPSGFTWSVYTGAAVSFGTPYEKNSTVSAGVDGARSLRLAVKDTAGNIGYGYQPWTWDSTAPGANAGSDVVTTSTSATITGSGSDALSPVSFAWTVASGTAVSFGSPTALSTAVSTSVDGTRVLRLTVTDSAGNSAFDDMSYAYDATAVAAPTITIVETPTLDGTPTWSWTSGGNGNGAWQYSSDSVTWTDTTTSSYTPTATLPDGTHYLYVREHDAVYGYYGAYASRGIYVTKVLPIDGATVADTTPYLQWRSALLSTYIVQIQNVSRVWGDVTGSLSVAYYQVTTAMPAGTYQWRVKVTSSKGGIVSYLPDSSGSTLTIK